MRLTIWTMLLILALSPRLGIAETAAQAQTVVVSTTDAPEDTGSLADDAAEVLAPAKTEVALSNKLNYIQTLMAITVVGESYPQAITQIANLIRHNPENTNNDVLQFYIGELFEKDDDNKSVEAAVSYLKLLYLYPDSQQQIGVNKSLSFLEIRPRGNKSRVQAMTAAAPTSGSNEERHWAFIKGIYGFESKDAAPMLARQMSAFAAQYADSPHAPEAIFMAAETLRHNKYWNAAIASYLQLRCYYPFAPRAPESQMLAADILAEERSNYSQAARLYRFLIDNYAGRKRLTTTALTKLGKIYEKQLKEYQLAIDVYLEIVAKYPESKLATKHLTAAGKLYTRRLKNTQAAIHVYERIADEYPHAKIAPEMMYTVGDMYEDLKMADMAIAAYQKCRDNFAESQYATKAQKRIDRLTE